VSQPVAVSVPQPVAAATVCLRSSIGSGSIGGLYSSGSLGGLGYSYGGSLSLGGLHGGSLSLASLHGGSLSLGKLYTGSSSLGGLHGSALSLGTSSVALRGLRVPISLGGLYSSGWAGYGYGQGYKG
jgi:hypothetical protein